MKNKSVTDFDKSVQELFYKANELLGYGNIQYAEELYLVCVLRAPEFVDARKKLREIQAKTHSNLFVCFISRIKIFLFRIFYGNRINEENLPVILMKIEETLCRDFKNKQAFLFLIKLARQIDYLELCVETLEYATNEFPRDYKLKFSLADGYIKLGQSKKAVEIMRQLLRVKPNNLAYQRKLQEANAVRVIDEKKWESDS